MSKKEHSAWFESFFWNGYRRVNANETISEKTFFAMRHLANRNTSFNRGDIYGVQFFFQIANWGRKEYTDLRFKK